MAHIRTIKETVVTVVLMVYVNNSNAELMIKRDQASYLFLIFLRL